VQPERDARVKRVQRGHITWGRVDLDAEGPADHEVRAIAAVVDKLDLRGEIAGAPASIASPRTARRPPALRRFVAVRASSG
jgi:hypothetical protein